MPSAELIADLKRDEGYAKRLPDDRCQAYADPISELARTGKGSGAPWTIGYGHCGPEVHQGLIWTRAQAETQLLRDVEEHNATLDHALPWLTKLNPVRRDVLYNMHFNMGWDNPKTPRVEGLAQFKNTLAAIEAGDYRRGAAGMLASKWAAQVGSRAQRLARQMITGVR